MTNLELLLNSSLKRKTIYLVLESFLFFFVLSVSIIIYLTFLSTVSFLPKFVLSFYFMVLLFIFVFIVVRFFYKINSVLKKEKVLFELSEKYSHLKDKPINAWQLINNLENIESLGLSKELAAKYIEEIDREVLNLDISKIVDFKKLYKFLNPVLCILIISISLYFNSSEKFISALLTVVSPWKKYEFKKYADVFPGNIKIPSGSEVEIKVKLKQGYEMYTPEIFVKTEDSNWNKIQVFSSGSEFISEKIYVISPLQYFASIQNIKSETFLIDIAEIPKLVNFRLKCYFPAYTGLEPRQTNSFEMLSYLAGTRIEFTADSTQPLKKAVIAFSDGKKMPLKLLDKTKITGQIVVEKNSEIWFELESTDDIVDISPAHYKINIKEDILPEISILSPAQDLTVSEGSQIKIIYKANDDFGLNEIKLNYLSKETKDNPKKILLNRFSDKKTEFTGEYTWNIKDIKPKAGEIVTYFLEVTDNDIISGPKKGYSEKYIIEIFSYEAEHEKIEKELKKFRNDLIDLLSKEIAFKTNFEQILKENRTPNPEQLKEYINQQKELQKYTKDIKDNIENILKKMEFDPYTNFQVYNEHKAISNSLEKISKNQMENVVSALSQQDYTKATRNIDEIIDNLERLNLISEDVLQYQTMQDLLSSAEKLNSLSEELQNGMNSFNGDPKVANELNKILDDIEKIMKDINNLIQKMPKDLPEEFINQQAVKQINISEIQDISKNIRDALNRADISSAIEQAKILQKQLKDMLDILKKASLDVKFESADSVFVEKVNKTLSQFKEIVEEQTKIIEETLEIENVRQKKVMKKEEEIIEKLTKLQKEAIKKTKDNLETSKRVENFLVKNQYVSITNRNLYKMEDVLKELTSKKIVKSKEWLKEIIMGFDDIAVMLNNYSVKISTENIRQQNICRTLLSENEAIKEIEQNILRELESRIEVEFSKAEQDKIKKLSDKQKETRNKAIELDRSVQELSRKTSLISSEISYRLKSASYEMQNAENKLNYSETNSALRSEQLALQYLTEGRDFMQMAGQQISETFQKFNNTMAGFLQSSRESGSAGGIFGVRLGHVKLPDINDYFPPKEFREELLKSLKEKYPESYQQIIKQYYKKLTE